MKPVPPADDPDTQSDVFSPMEAQHFRWNELSTTDPDAALDFYARHFGWTQEGQMQMGDLGSYRFIQKDGVGIGAVMPKDRKRTRLNSSQQCAARMPTSA